MIINPYFLVSMDPDAAAFISATGISGTNATAIENLVLDLKAANLWNKGKAFYPIIGGTATSCKFNLKNPADTDAAYRLNFVGGWTFSATEAIPNGTNAYADTFVNPSLNLTLNNTHMSIYLNSCTNSAFCDMGAYVTNTSEVGIYGKWSDFNTILDQYDNSTTRLSSSAYCPIGLLISTRTSSNSHRSFINTTVWGNNVANSTGTRPNAKIYISALNNNGTASTFSTRPFRFASIGDGLTPTEAQVFSQIVEKYQVALGRSVTSAKSFYYDRTISNETNAFLYATQITDSTIKTAINTTINDLKTNNLYSKLTTWYPMVGGTASNHGVNLILPGTYTATFYGGWTHNNSGAKPNGTNAYATTGMTPSVVFNQISNHMSYYNVTNSPGGSAYPNGKTEIGDSSTNTQMALSVGNDVNVGVGGSIGGFINAAANLGAGADPRGNVILTRTSSSMLKAYRNGSLLATNTTTLGIGLPFTFDLNLGCFYFSDGTQQRTNYSDRQCASATFGSGLSDSEAATLYTIIQNFNTMLGRSVGPQTVSDPDAQAFINAASIQDQVEATAVNNLVIGLKADGLWTKMRAIYPIVGGSASSHAVNLKTPGTYNLTFATGMTHSSNGMVSNGTSGYANTSFNPSVQLTQNSASYGLYSRTNRANSDDKQHGVINGSIYTLFLIRNLFNNIQNFLNSSTSTAIANSDSRGFFQMSRTTSTNTFHSRNNSVTTVSLTSNGNPNGNVFFCCRNLNGTPNSFDDVQISFAYCGEGLTDTEMSNFYTAVQAYQTTLSRQV